MNRARELSTDPWLARWLLLKALSALDLDKLIDVIEDTDIAADEPRLELVRRLSQERFGQDIRMRPRPPRH